jgi:hypothetical protein
MTPLALLRRPVTHLSLLVLGTAGALALLASRARDWVVMTDELQYAKLATAFASGDVLPTLRGEHVSAYAQLYPALLAPLYGWLSAPSAFHAAHVLNAVLFASAAIPAYLLAREAELSPRWSLVGALLTVAVPWTVLTAFVMTESVAYSVFLWALLACQRALVAPSPRRDLVAVAALAVAVLARTQFLVLAGVLALAALLVDGRRVLIRHRLLAVAYAVGAVVVAVLGTRTLGPYSVAATHGSIVSWEVLEQAGAHLDVIGVGIALLPLLLGGAWLVDAAWRRDPFAMLALVTLAAIALESSSYDVRLGGGLLEIRSRYVFYVGPLLTIAMLRPLQARRIPRFSLVGVTVFVAVTALAHGFPRVERLYVDAPSAAVNDVIQDGGGRVFVSLMSVVVALAIARLPRIVVAPVVVTLVLAGSVGVAAAAWTRLLESRGPSGRLIAHPPDVVYDWVDTTVPDGAVVAIVPYPIQYEWELSAIFWWDVEFWNRSVDRAYVGGDTWDYAPFPHRQLRVDPQTGIVAGTEDAPEYVVTAASDARLRITGSRIAQNYGLDVLHVARPWQVDWTTSGLDPDGWTRPGRPAAVHVFAPRSQDVQVEVQLTRADELVGNVWSDAGVVTVVRELVCVPISGSIAVALPSKPVQTAPPLPLGPGKEQGPRRAGLRVGAVALHPSGKPCS